jgi:hypothetical protein
MPVTSKILGQAIPIASTLVICNQLAAATTFSVAASPAGAALAAAQMLFLAAPLDPSQTLTVTIGMTLATTDVVRVSSASGAVSFNLFGQETS